MYEFEDDYLIHYGTPRHSGRYPWGSGENPYQRNSEFMRIVNNLKKKGMSDVEIAKKLNMSTGQLRDRKSIARAEIEQYEIAKAVTLREKGMSLSAIAIRLGRQASGESYVRGLLKKHNERKENVVLSTANMLKKQVEEKGYIDIGEGVETELGITQVNLRAAKQKLLDEGGYKTYNVQVEQATNPGKYTTVLVLCKDDSPYPNFKENPEIIKPIKAYSMDNGKSYLDIYYPESISSKRLEIKYSDEGGLLKDGVIELRRGAADLSLGGTEYAQVRIAVDDSHYLKGMAVYADDLPDGVDIRFNSNKPSGTPLEKVLKPFKTDKTTGEIDRDNPFGASIKAKNGQRFYIDPETGEKKLSPVNIVREEGDWDEYAKTLPSQFLSKQPKVLIDKQLNLSYADAKDELAEIENIHIPEIKKAFLNDFADNCDKASYELKAASLPGQSSKVLLPINSLNDDEVYAPTYPNGTKLALVRYPHGSITEIPIVTVNNKNEEGIKMMGNDAVDAIGINKKVASQLSGADFDGDSVTAIPTKHNGVNIVNRPQLEGLKDFDPELKYSGYPGMPKMTDAQKGREMGVVSNLLTDMTLQGASDDEVERALKQSMIVVDAQKHGYDYKRSADDLAIQDLKDKYQGGGGASSLISKAKSPVYERAIKRYAINPDTGEKIPVYDTNEWIDKKTGEIRYRTEERPYLSTVKDANEAVSPFQNAKEKSYANYSNSMKQLGNDARKKSLKVGSTVYDKDAAKIFEPEVTSIKDKIYKAVANAPKERQAQLFSASVVADKIRKNEWDSKINKEDIKKVSTKSIAAARARYGAAGKNVRITLTDREWEAIQSGALHSTDINKVIRYGDKEALKKLAIPKTVSTLSESKKSRILAMNVSGYTIADIADTLGVSTSTVSRALKEERGV